MNRHVWVIEGRRLPKTPWQAEYQWRVQTCSYSLKRLREELKVYRDGRNPRSEFRIRKYTPASQGRQFHDDGEGNKHSGARGDCQRCQ